MAGRRVLVNMVLFIVFCFSQGFAGEHIDHGPTGTANHDYYSAMENPQIKNLLQLVEKHHLDSCPHNPRGVLGDIAEGKYHYAISDLHYTLERFVNHPRALQLMGSLAKLTKNPLLPIGSYERALRLYPQYAVTYVQYGSYLVDIEQIEEGMAKLSRAREIDPKLALVYVLMAKAYAKNGNLVAARQAAEQARTLGYKGKIWDGIQ